MFQNTSIIKGRDLSHLELYKITNENEIHYQFQYQDGLNIDHLNFNPKGEDEPGGLYFCELKFLPKYLYKGCYIRRVLLDPDEDVYYINNKFKAKRIFVEPRMLISEFIIDDYSKCMNLVKINGLFLQFVPNELQTKELITIALQQNGFSLQFVIETFIDTAYEEFCKLAINQNPNTVQYIFKFADQLKGNLFQLCYYALNKDIHVLQFIPIELRNMDMYKILANNNGTNLRHIPDSYKTKEICNLAIINTPYAIEFIPDSKKTTELYKLLLSHNGIHIIYIPEKDRSYELCKIAVENNLHAITFVPKNMINIELCKICLNKDIKAFWYLEPVIPDTLYSDIIFEVIRTNPAIFEHIPKKHKNINFLKYAIYTDYSLFNKIEEDLITYDICLITVSGNGSMLQFVPNKFMTYDLCRLAITRTTDKMIITFVPFHLKSLELYRLAVQQNREALEYVPEFYKPEFLKTEFSESEFIKNHESQEILNNTIKKLENLQVSSFDTQMEIEINQ